MMYPLTSQSAPIPVTPHLALTEHNCGMKEPLAQDGVSEPGHERDLIHQGLEEVESRESVYFKSWAILTQSPV